MDQMANGYNSWRRRRTIKAGDLGYVAQQGSTDDDAAAALTHQEAKGYGLGLGLRLGFGSRLWLGLVLE